MNSPKLLLFRRCCVPKIWSILYTARGFDIGLFAAARSWTGVADIILSDLFQSSYVKSPHNVPQCFVITNITLKIQLISSFILRTFDVIIPKDDEQTICNQNWCKNIHRNFTILRITYSQIHMHSSIWIRTFLIQRPLTTDWMLWIMTTVLNMFNSAVWNVRLTHRPRPSHICVCVCTCVPQRRARLYACALACSMQVDHTVGVVDGMAQTSVYQ